MKKDNNENDKNYMTEGLAIGMCLGILIGTAIKKK